jgi:hypothetical protein
MAWGRYLAGVCLSIVAEPECQCETPSSDQVWLRLSSWRTQARGRPARSGGGASGLPVALPPSRCAVGDGCAFLHSDQVQATPSSRCSFPGRCYPGTAGVPGAAPVVGHTGRERDDPNCVENNASGACLSASITISSSAPYRLPSMLRDPCPPGIGTVCASAFPTLPVVMCFLLCVLTAVLCCSPAQCDCPVFL